MQTSETYGKRGLWDCVAGETWLTHITVAIQGQVNADCRSVSLVFWRKGATALGMGKSNGQKTKAKRNLETDRIA